MSDSSGFQIPNSRFQFALNTLFIWNLEFGIGQLSERPVITFVMSHQFAPGDDLVFQVESGLGLLRLLAIDGEGPDTVWHLLAYEEFFPSVEATEEALKNPTSLHVGKQHMALTDRAFERTPASRLGNRPLNQQELAPVNEWRASEPKTVSDRSALLQLGIR